MKVFWLQDIVGGINDGWVAVKIVLVVVMVGCGGNGLVSGRCSTPRGAERMIEKGKIEARSGMRREGKKANIRTARKMTVLMSVGWKGIGLRLQLGHVGSDAHHQAIRSGQCLRRPARMSMSK